MAFTYPIKLEDRFTPEAIEFMEKKADKFDAKLDKEKYMQAKLEMNKWFGPENNQIARPTAQSFAFYILKKDGLLDSNRKHKYDLTSVKHIIEPGVRYSNQYCLRFNLCTVYVRFPELTITNSEGASHDIKDLWVLFSVDPKFSISDLRGIRSQLTRQEAISGYMHSHLHSALLDNRSNAIEAENFCLGQGEINQVITKLALGGYQAIDFTLFCLHLKNYVVWESIEGVPYNYIKKIATTSRASRNRRSGVDPIAGTRTDATVVHLVKELLKLDDSTIAALISPSIQGDKATFQLGDLASRYFAALIREKGYEEWSLSQDTINQFLCYEVMGSGQHPQRVGFISIRNDLYNQNLYEQSDDGVVEPDAPLFIYKEEPVYLKIIKPQTNGTQQQETTTSTTTIPERNEYVHEQLLNLVRQRLQPSDQFSETCYTFEGAIKTNTLDHIFQTTGPDLLPV